MLLIAECGNILRSKDYRKIVLQLFLLSNKLHLLRMPSRLVALPTQILIRHTLPPTKVYSWNAIQSQIEDGIELEQSVPSHLARQSYSSTSRPNGNPNHPWLRCGLRGA